MAISIYHGNIIGGGGTSIIQVTKAQYNANKDVYDASEAIIEITDETEDNIISADEIAYDNTSSGLSAETIQDAIDEIGAISVSTENVINLQNDASFTPPHTGFYRMFVGTNNTQEASFSLSRVFEDVWTIEYKTTSNVTALIYLYSDITYKASVSTNGVASIRY